MAAEHLSPRKTDSLPSCVSPPLCRMLKDERPDRCYFSHNGLHSWKFLFRSLLGPSHHGSLCLDYCPCPHLCLSWLPSLISIQQRVWSFWNKSMCHFSVPDPILSDAYKAPDDLSPTLPPHLPYSSSNFIFSNLSCHWFHCSQTLLNITQRLQLCSTP